MVRHLLLTTDLSESARRAFAPAGEIALGLRARITLLTVVQLLIDGEPAGMHSTPIALGDPEQERIHALESMTSERRALEAVAPGVEVSVEAITGTAIAPTILTYAAEHEVNMIVLATHARGGLKRMVMGSIAELVLRHAHVPVLCIPPAIPA